MSKRDAAADLAMLNKTCDFCHGEGAFETAIHGVHDVCLECHGTGRDEPTECLEIAEYWIERAEHLEAENEELRQELARLHKIIADATGHSKDGDGVDLLCKALYGRPGQVPDWLGGSEARMLYDAVEEIEELRAEAHALDRLRAWRKGCNSRSVFLNDPLLHLCGVDPGGKVVNVFVDAADSASDDPVPADVLMGTQENPAPFAEMVDAALARWAELYGEEQP